MMTPQHYVMLQNLEKALKEGAITATTHVGPGTFVCITHPSSFGMTYTQIQYDEMPKDMQALLNGKAKGEKAGPVKVVAVFDVWPITFEKRGTPVQVFDN